MWRRHDLGKHHLRQQRQWRPARDNSTVTGNWIGTNALGTGDLGKPGAAVFINGWGDVIGGKSSGIANVIAFNADRGVQIDRGTKAAVRGSSIFSNASIGIDLVAPADGFPSGGN